jgi:hypothetical protein
MLTRSYAVFKKFFQRREDKLERADDGGSGLDLVSPQPCTTTCFVVRLTNTSIHTHQQKEVNQVLAEKEQKI